MTRRRAGVVTKRRDAGVATKALSASGVTWEFMLPGTAFNYAREVGDGLRSGIIVALLTWLMRTFPEAPLIVEKRTKEVWEIQYDDPLEILLERPNPSYDGRVLWMATVMDFAFGEAYWLKVRDGLGKVVELWWMPRALVRPIFDPLVTDPWIDHYEYTVAGRRVNLPVQDVVHFRFGMDPANPRRGFSQLAAIFREVYVDDQAANFTASILRNMGIVGLVVSPKSGTPALPPGKVKELKDYLAENFTGDKRGQGLVLSNPVDVQLLQYNLQGFDVGPIRDIGEERASAAIGIPAAVVGFGTGLNQTKVGATMEQMIRLVWRQKIMPEQKIMCGELKRSLVSDFHTYGAYRVRFDASKIHALWEDDVQKAQRIATLVEGSLLTVAQGLRELGYPAEAKHEYYLRKVTVQAVPADNPMQQVARVTVTDKTPPTDLVTPEGPVTPPPQGSPDDVGDPVA